MHIKLKKANYNKPLGLLEYESISVVNPNPEPLPKPPELLLDMLISLKELSILPEPMDDM